MRILADLAQLQIIEVAKNPPIGELVDCTGRVCLPVPEGVTLRVTPSSIVLPPGDPNSIIRQSYAGLLARYPQYNNILYNPLLEATDMAELDPTGVLAIGAPVTITHPARFQMGRGIAPAGAAPGSVAMLESNDSLGAGLERPGVITTTTIDIGPYTADLGADEFMVYWYLYEISVSTDVSATIGAFAGQNVPTLRQWVEIDQEPTNFEAYLSLNDGANYFPVERMTPIAFCNPGRYIRLAFKNESASAKRFLAAYALLF